MPSDLHADTGSIRLISDGARASAERRIYHPFGEMQDFAIPVAIATASEEMRGWIGERFDAGAGLKYLNARYYDPELGLFLQPDWFEVTEPGVGTNRYTYSFNDPVNVSDRGGNCAWDACVFKAAAIAAVTVVVYGAYIMAKDALGMSIVDVPDLSFEGMTAFPEDGARILDTPTQQPEPWVEVIQRMGRKGRRRL